MATSDAQSSKSPALRVAFLTDTHLPASGRNSQFRKVLDLAQNQYRADVLLFGGDNVMGVEVQPLAEAKSQLANWREMISQTVKVPYASCIGNHDLWGWSSKGNKDLYTGKRMAMDAFDMPGRYYSFERAGWRFLMLDAIQPGPYGYSTSIDEEQFEWLRREIQKSVLPTLIVSHAPVLSVTGLLMGGPKPGSSSFRVPSHKYLANSHAIVELLAERPQVKVCLSGHMHMIDEVKYRGVRHVCGGAVCGGWWRGPFEKFDPAFVLVDLFKDGGSRHHVIHWDQAS